MRPRNVDSTAPVGTQAFLTQTPRVGPELGSLPDHHTHRTKTFARGPLPS
jgi:hypothetical protein